MAQCFDTILILFLSMIFVALLLFYVDNNTYGIAYLNNLHNNLNETDSKLSTISSFYKDKSIVITGMIHNAQDTLPHTLEQLNEIAYLFNNAFFLFWESNSIDNTSQILKNWSINNTLQSNNGSHIIHKTVLFGNNYTRNEFSKYTQSEKHNLSRVDRYVGYRNMLLKQLYNLDTFGIDIDYIFLMDLDIYDIDWNLFLYELSECPYDIMCVNGVESFNHYRDTYASVEVNHNWIYRPYIKDIELNEMTRADYKHIIHELRILIPRDYKRFTPMQSCFGGLTAYKISPQKLKQINCTYLTDKDIKEILYNNITIGNNDAKWLKQIKQLVDWRDYISFRFNYKGDFGYEHNLCEHIAFHYCLKGRDDKTIAIANNAKLYYFPLTNMTFEPFQVNSQPFV